MKYNKYINTLRRQIKIYRSVYFEMDNLPFKFLVDLRGSMQSVDIKCKENSLQHAGNIASFLPVLTASG